MSQISKDGAITLRKNIEGPLKVIWEKLIFCHTTFSMLCTNIYINI